MNPLFTTLPLGPLTLANRIVMAPLTRCRATADHTPRPLMAEYYAQRATAGLQIAEATMIAPGCSAYGNMPGVYTAEQVAGWKTVTDAVHAQGGRLFLQLWHGGRTSHSLLNDGVMPVAPSAVRIENDRTHTPQGKVDFETPRALTVVEIRGIVEQFAQAARNAQEAGFDGVEIHGANGYLIDQFLRDGTNQRTDEYGGPLENRLRFLREVLEAVIPVFGAERTGLRISPLNSYNEMKDSAPLELTRAVAALANELGIGYLHIMRGDFMGLQHGDTLGAARPLFHGVLMGNAGFTPAEAAQAIETGALDLVAFGHHFISNPDLVERVRGGHPLVEPDVATFYTNGAQGYTDYPAL